MTLQNQDAEAVFRKFSVDFCCRGDMALGEAVRQRGIDAADLERELPELIELARKVESVHRDHPQVPRGLVRLLQQIRGDLESHMKKEQLILFPAMQRHAGNGFDAPIAQMRHDHIDHGEHLRRLEDMTGGFALPDGACRSWQALYSGAAKLRDDLIEHIHLENNVLFPRFPDQ